MTIETKFNPTEKIWVILDGKAKEFPINSVKTDSDRNESSKIQYFVNVGSEKDYKCKIFDEKDCFKSREDLINSL